MLGIDTYVLRIFNNRRSIRQPSVFLPASRSQATNQYIREKPSLIFIPPRKFPTHASYLYTSSEPFVCPLQEKASPVMDDLPPRGTGWVDFEFPYMLLDIFLIKPPVICTNFAPGSERVTIIVHIAEETSSKPVGNEPCIRPCGALEFRKDASYIRQSPLRIPAFAVLRRTWQLRGIYKDRWAGEVGMA